MIRYVKHAEDAPLLPPPPEPHKEEAGLSRATLAGIVGAGVAGYVRNKKEEIKAGKRSWGDVGVGALVGTGFGSMLGYGVADSLLRSARRGPDSLLRGIARHHGMRRGAAIASGLIGGGVGAVGGAILTGGKSRPRAMTNYEKEASVLPLPSQVLPIPAGGLAHAVKPSTIAKAVKSMKPMHAKIAIDFFLAEKFGEEQTNKEDAALTSGLRATAAASLATVGAAGLSAAHEKPISAKHIVKMRKNMGAGHVPIVTSNFQKAVGPGIGQMFSAYAKPEHLDAIKEHPIYESKGVPRAAKEHGAIFTHTKGAPSVIAHEMGHAGPKVSKVRNVTLGAYGASKVYGVGAGGIVGGYVAGRMARKGEDPKATARRGMIAGAVGGLAGGAPMLAEEGRASYRAMKGLKSIGHGPKKLLHAGVTLGAAGLSYVAAAAGGGAAFGGPTAALTRKDDR
jgi:hypothetical protein